MKDQILAGLIDQLIKSGNTAVWCGAGISVPSKIPMAGYLDEKSDRVIDGIIPEILRLIHFSDEEIKSFFKAKIPFEAFIELLLSHGLSIGDLKDVFNGNPSAYHYALAEYVGAGYLKAICTTNFDTCIEQAISDIGASPMPVAIDATDFPGFIAAHPQDCLIKIHGSVEMPEFMAVTIKEIAKQQNRTRGMVTGRFFTLDSSYDNLLIIGYSCSDYFDIVPMVQELIRKDPARLNRVYFWDFKRGMPPKIASFASLPKNVRAMFNGHPDFYAIRGDLSFALYPVHGPAISLIAKDWRAAIAHAFNLKIDPERQLLRARVLYQCDSLQSAFDTLEEIIKSRKPSLTERAHAYSLYALILKRWGRLEKALDIHRIEQRLYTKLKDRKGLIISYGNRALVLRRLGKRVEALKFHMREEKICRQLRDWGGVARSYGNQALILKYENSLDAAYALHNKERRIFKRIGDQSGIARSYGNQALVLRRKGAPDRAALLLKKEQRIYLELGMRNLLAHNYESQAMILADLNRFDEALAYHRLAAANYRYSNDQTGLITDYANRAELAGIRMGNRKEGLRLINKGLKLATANKDGNLPTLKKIKDQLLKT